MRIWLSIIISAILFSTHLFASLGELKLLKRERFLFNNIDCIKNNSCSLKTVKYLIEDYRVEMLDGFNFGTRLFVEYETETTKDLENYVFVQFIRGCIFDSIQSGGEVINRLHYSLGGKEEDFNYLNWVLDSDDKDPSYISVPGERHYWYRWNKINDSFDRNTETFFGIKKPDSPKLYVTDRPGTAFAVDSKAKNLSLGLKMCLYKSVDVPTDITVNSKLGQPIYCYDWSSSWIYDHLKKEYDSPYGISPTCK